MKKILFLLLCIYLGLTNINAQVLEKEMSSTSQFWSGSKIINTNYIYLEKEKQTIEIYDQDLNLIKTTINLPIYAWIAHASYNYFTADSRYAFVLAFREKTDEGYSPTTYKLYDESGMLLFDFEEYEPRLTLPSKFVTAHEIYSDGNATSTNRVYTVTGGLMNGTSQVIQEKSDKIYPNPSKELITIEYKTDTMETMTITSVNGSSVENILLDPSVKKLTINVSAYAPGMYIYTYGKNSGRFIIK